MMNHARIIFSALMLCFLPVFSSAASLTLEECVEQGMSFNPQMKAYRLAIGEAEEGVSEALSAFLPTFSVDYNYTYLENDSDALDRDYRSQDSDRFTLRLSQPLFTGMSGVAGLNKARQSQNYHEYQLMFMQRQLTREIHASFYDILHASKLVEKWSESITRLERQREIAKAWVEQELAPRLRLMEIESEYYNILQQLASARARLASGEASLREWIALEDNEPIDLEGSLQNPGAINCGSAEACLEQALNQRPEIKLAQLNISMAREDNKSILARNLPRVSLDASRVDYTRDFDGGLVDDEEQKYYTVAVNVSMQPFQGGRNVFAYRRQKLAVKRFENELINQRASIVTEVRSRYQELLEGQSLVESAAKGLEVAREIYSYTEHSSRLGVNSLDDLLDAELRLTQAEVNKIDAEFAVRKARISLGYATGEQPLGQ